MTRRITICHRKSGGLYVHIPKDLVAVIGQGRKNFRSKAEAETFVTELTAEREIRAKMNYIKVLFRDFESCRNALETGGNLPSISLSDAFRKVIEAKKQSGKRSNTVATLTCSLKSFAAHCHKPAGDVLPADIEAWLYANTWTPKTRRGRLVDLNTAYAWLVKRKIVASNPVSAVEVPAVTFKPVKILSVQNIRQLLETSRATDPALLPFLSLVLFGGLRVAEARRCHASNLINGVIDLGGENCKLNERRCIKISTQLAAWLAIYDFEAVDVSDFYERMGSLQKASGVTIPQNALRHSFCSYHLPIIGAEATARAANNSAQMIFKHYAAMVTDEEAKRFVELRPTP